MYSFVAFLLSNFSLSIQFAYNFLVDLICLYKIMIFLWTSNQLKFENYLFDSSSSTVKLELDLWLANPYQQWLIFFGLNLTFFNINDLWTTTTCQHLPLFWGPSGVRLFVVNMCGYLSCSQPKSCFTQYTSINSCHLRLKTTLATFTIQLKI